MVAPLVGAWIETCSLWYDTPPHQVAPLVGAWIETYTELYADEEQASRSPRGSVD